MQTGNLAISRETMAMTSPLRAEEKLREAAGG